MKRAAAALREQRVLIVDDSPENLAVLAELLSPHYRVLAANGGEAALRLMAREPRPDLLLLDVSMPGVNGFEVLQRLQADPATRDIPVIFTTALHAAEDEKHGFDLGAVDYITKPLRPAVVLARVRTHLELKQARDREHAEKLLLQAEILTQARENLAIQDVTIRALARLAETRDNETGRHILRTQAYVQRLGQSVRQQPRFEAELDDQTLDQIVRSAPLHDIGKVGIPDRVLLKPGPLTPEERVEMQAHSRMGAEAIERAVADTHHPMAFLCHAHDIAMHHHERWDGQGYPQGLRGDAIPLAARLMAVADVFDAMVSPRVYRPAMPFEVVREHMASMRGTHFDPDLLDAFMADFEGYCAIARRLADEAPVSAQEQERPTPEGAGLQQ